ncbi:hypothetical protein GCM10017667_53480 [Streptomyces filamentosus]|uniref:Uncharacterized protein n=1 Tax=Streptomyces filamentosus TaxID=67294 RepID=A0A919BTD4_STRFL|nr:hypothetical protein GCM10017667_53480 [Streptomyces filamentosus]
MSSGFDGEQGHLVRSDVVRVARQLADSVMRHHDGRFEGTQVRDETADDLVEGRVDEPGLTGRRLGISGVTVAEQPRGTGAQDGKGCRKLRGAAAAWCPGGGDDGGASAGGVVLREHPAGEETFVVRVREHP